MNPQAQFCPNKDCRARGRARAENSVIHSQKEKRYRCKTCGKTFSETTGSDVWVKKDLALFVIVVTLLAYGCPVQAIVMAFGLDDETVRAWLKKAGQHCQGVHEHYMEQSSLELEQVQADEIKVKIQGGTVWMAMGMMVRTRLWLGGVVGANRDKGLIRELTGQIRQWALCRPILVAVDGFSAYLKSFREAFRSPYKGGKGGRPRLYVWEEVAIVQVIKRRVQATLTVEHRIAQGCAELVERLIVASQKAATINTAFIELAQCNFSPAPGSTSERCRGRATHPAAAPPSARLHCLRSASRPCRRSSSPRAGWRCAALPGSVPGILQLPVGPYRVLRGWKAHPDEAARAWPARRSG
jgi:transposase-like protein